MKFSLLEFRYAKREYTYLIIFGIYTEYSYDKVLLGISINLDPDYKKNKRTKIIDWDFLFLHYLHKRFISKEEIL